jgi:hypothetical protein
MRNCDRVTLRDGFAIERVAYMDPPPLLAPIARSPEDVPPSVEVRRWTLS